MSQKEPANWNQIDALFDQALDLPAADRQAFVLAQTPDQPQLRQRVMELLKACEDAGDFLETGPQTKTVSTGRPEALDREQGLPVGHQIGPWRITSWLGRGGMGEVYRAERDDGLYDQVVALKLLRLDQPEQLARFESERQILARLDHPNLARLIDGGVTAQGRPWMAMEFVNGQSLKDWLRNQQPDLKTRLQLLLKLCPAVSHAHERLVVHRDIKPDNILVDAKGEPRLLDFGIAKLTADSLDAEQTQALATPNYAAPEQLTGEPITTATDVYGLGATLYFLLCQQAPVQLQGLSLPSMLDAICHHTPAAPSSLAGTLHQDDIRGDLDAICAQALARKSAQRYASVNALAADIQRHLQHQPIQARELSRLARGLKFVRRNLMVSGAATAIACSLLAGIGLASWQAQEAAQERDLARRDADRLASMRSAMLQLFRSAASETDSEQLTVDELFGRSAQKVAKDFSTDPATAAGLMQMLGELQLSTENYSAAQTLLEQAYQLPHEQIPADILASIEIDLAHLAYRDGNYQQARQLYDSAQQVWQQAPEKYPTERIWAATLASQLARAQGHTGEAVTALQEAAEAARAHWGDWHQETGIVLINLAVAYYYDNQLPQALSACAEAWEVWQHIDRTDSPDALNLLSNWGLFALRSGRPYEGEKRLAEALELRTQLYGASAAQATLMKNLGVAHRINGRKNAGMRLLEQGEWMARQYAGLGGRLHASAVYALANALIEEGQTQEAKTMVSNLLQAVGDKDFSWRYMNQAVLARLMTQDKELSEAQALFSSALLALRSAGKAALSQLSDAQHLRARWYAERQDLPNALKWLDQAIASKTNARRPGHFEVIRMQHEKAQTLLALGQVKAAAELLQAARSLARQELGHEHPLSQL